MHCSWIKSELWLVLVAIFLTHRPSAALGLWGFSRRTIGGSIASSVTVRASTMTPRKRSKTCENDEKQGLTPRTENSLFYQWAAHDSASYHSFDDARAAEIRTALLTWYRAHRRKLPWRGDAPPYNGSTADTNRSKKKTTESKQPGIQKFFESSTKTTSVKQEEETDGAVGEVVPVTGYGVWVSEIMLQQTRVEAVIPYYLKWMTSFPTVHDLAKATEEEVNSHWAGLGFYRRARLLHKGAKRVVDDYDGELPRTVEGLQKLDGIGRYTASAVASIAYGLCVPVVDGNVCRVLSRLTGIANHIKAPVLKDDLGWVLARQIVHACDGSHAGEVNQALMELGATYCAPSGTGMDDRDPLKPFYTSTKLGIAFAEERKRFADSSCLPVTGTGCKLCGEDGVETALQELALTFDASANRKTVRDFCPGRVGHSVFPLAPPKGEKREEVLAVAILSHTSNHDQTRRWLLIKRPAKGLLAGQWEFPSACVWSSADQFLKAKKKRKGELIEVPFVDEAVREKALDEFVDELFSCGDGDAILASRSRLRVGDSPLVHIFSHVRHTMWLECAELHHVNYKELNAEQTASNGRIIRWMSEADMKTVGVTSGVKKILKAVAAKSKAKLSCKE